MTDERRFYRARDALIGGVCAGMADYFNVDPLVVRILAIVLTLVSGGLFAIAYAVLWIVVPKEPEVSAPFDVEPQEVHSDTYGAVGRGSRKDGEQGPGRPASPATMAGWRYASGRYPVSGHVPPEPPVAASWAPPGVPPAPPQAQPSGPPTYRRPPAPAPAWESWPPVPGSPAADCKEPSPAKVKAAVIVGLFLLFFGIAMIASQVIADVSWWQCWPLVLVMLGIARMVIPDAEGWRLDGFSLGIVLFSLGAMLLPMSLGIVSWLTVALMIEFLWPLLCVIGGLLVIGAALESPGLRLAAALLFTAFCAAGLVWCAVPGATEGLVLMAPFGREYRFFLFA